ncbi:hypothetical protein DL98DRAFT_610503 [Cadophora sp. DSE1049]|nr:hypothetical protein DL98DRAFT_610503 [Cadophora sp. DSE1049]
MPHSNYPTNTRESSRLPESPPPTQQEQQQQTSLSPRSFRSSSSSSYSSRTLSHRSESQTPASAKPEIHTTRAAAKTTERTLTLPQYRRRDQTLDDLLHTNRADEPWCPLHAAMVGHDHVTSSRRERAAAVEQVLELATFTESWRVDNPPPLVVLMGGMGSAVDDAQTMLYSHVGAHFEGVEDRFGGGVYPRELVRSGVEDGGAGTVRSFCASELCQGSKRDTL